MKGEQTEGKTNGLMGAWSGNQGALTQPEGVRGSILTKHAVGQRRLKRISVVL